MLKAVCYEDAIEAKKSKLYCLVFKKEAFVNWRPLKHQEQEFDTTFEDLFFMTRNFAFEKIPSL